MRLKQFFSSSTPNLPKAAENTSSTSHLNEAPPSADVQLFLRAVLSLSAGQRLDPILQRAVNHEEYLRKLFATDRGHCDLVDPFVGLFDAFAQKSDVWKIIGRPSDERHDEHFIFPLSPLLRKKPGTLAIVPTIYEFERNWNLFTHSILSNISWNNIIAAGGSVLASLEPFEGNPSNEQRSEHYQSTFATSDIDLFIWGLDANQAKAKMVEIYQAICTTVPLKVICVRKPNVVSIHTLFPARHVQIILRLYRSPAEVLAGFDIDSCCFAYDGCRLWTCPRGLASCIRQSNTVDLTRRSPSYEVRMAKYARRGHEVYLPSLSREKIDPSIFFHPSPKHPNGLARLLILERLYFGDPILGIALYYPWRRVLARGVVCAGPGHLRNIDVQSSDYDIAWVIPYGPSWTPQRIAKSVKLINNRLNGPWPLSEAGRRLHRHPLFAGPMGDCLEDFCPGCPFPYGEDERQLVVSESNQYIRGPIKFLEANPGQQLLTGSFQPLDMNGWEDDAYGTNGSSDGGDSDRDGDSDDSV
ncbi:hypothetical protein GALMADRAFT_148613 [Galerina marginata CBS 339.88]|uniref:Uncharacterized protein n=1 Tax=Galerina marginata (strain CBS 339.88) TaxID=685588 RepID=A0A067SCT7_GALM3|nr:hypothetical protein GALMADRAFT_148613 [Galerina marginata CBS 339.88]